MSRVPVNQPYDTSQSVSFGARDPAAKFLRHAGIDYGVPTGREVYAPASGTVTGYTGGQYTGNVVEIFTGQDYPHVFHNSQLLVSPGQKVTEGQLIAKSGATGQGVTGPHVHFGVGKKSIPNITSFDDYIDPNQWLKQGDDEMSQATVDQIYKDLHGVDERNAKKIDDLSRVVNQAQINLGNLSNIVNQAQINIQALRDDIKSLKDK